MYGKTALVEELRKIVGTELGRFIKESGLKLLSDPLANESQKDLDADQEDFELLYDIAYSPEVDAWLDKDDRFSFYLPVIDDKMVEEEMAILLERCGELVDAETVEATDFVKGELVELDDEGKEKEGGIRVEDAALLLSRVADEVTINALVGATTGSRVVLNPSRACPNEVDRAVFLNTTKEEVGRITSDFALTIALIKRYAEAKPTQEFFDRMCGVGAVNGLEEFRERLRRDMRYPYLGQANRIFAEDVRERMLEKNKDVALPEDFLRRVFELKDNKSFMEIVENDPSIYRNEIRWSLVKEKLVKKYQITSTDEEAREIAIAIADAQLLRYNGYSLPREQLEEIADNLMGNEERRKEFHEKVEENKLFLRVKSEVSMEMKEVPIEEFRALLSRKLHVKE
jgi:trigger factor